jgi:aminoglycoside phosphotransferase (APT) family kinase protein
LLHGDYRLDNIFFRGDGIVAIDWDLVSQGRGILDWAYFIMGTLREDVDVTSELKLL